MPAKRDVATDLAENMLRVLEARRGLGPESYPLPLRRLAELTDPSATPEIVQKAAGKRKPFGERAIVVRPKDPDSPVALIEDVEQLAASPRTLEYLLAALCTPTEPTCDIARLKKALPLKLKKPFEAAVRRRIETRDLPAGVSLTEVKKKKLLYLDRYPPPPPAEDILGGDLLKALLAQRQAGGDAYPPTLARLVDLARPGAAAKLVQGALGRPAFSERVHIALNKRGKTQRLESPVAVVEDREMLADNPVLLEVAVALARSDATQLVSVKDLKSKISSSLEGAFMAALGRRLASDTLPPTIGRLLLKNKPLLFLLCDVRSGLSPVRATPTAIAAPPAAISPAPPPTATPFDFARAFEEAFDRLDRQRGHNFVSLVELRQALRADRPTFDAGLQALRRAGRFTLSAAEGRDGISPEENQAGIREDGSLLLYVSRRLS
jgi:hypothetical protein